MKIPQRTEPELLTRYLCLSFPSRKWELLQLPWKSSRDHHAPTRCRATNSTDNSSDAIAKQCCRVTQGAAGSPCHDPLNTACKSAPVLELPLARLRLLRPFRKSGSCQEIKHWEAAAGAAPSQPWHQLTATGDGSSGGASSRCKTSYRKENFLLQDPASHTGDAKPWCCQRVPKPAHPS